LENTSDKDNAVSATDLVFVIDGDAMRGSMELVNLAPTKSMSPLLREINAFIDDLPSILQKWMEEP
jgi:hypothetical protein